LKIETPADWVLGGTKNANFKLPRWGWLVNCREVKTNPNDEHFAMVGREVETPWSKGGGGGVPRGGEGGTRK